MTPLRKRFIEDMQLRNFSPNTQRHYIDYVAGFAQYYHRSPEHLGLDDIRQYQLHLIEDRKLSSSSVNTFVSAIQFLYLTTLEMPWKKENFIRSRVEHKLPVVPAPDEVRRLFDHIPGIKNRMALMLCFGAGLRVSEAVAVQTEHIDSARQLLRVEQGKGAKDRYTCLSPALIELLRNYFRIVRPPKPWLFPGIRPQRHISSGILQRACAEAWKLAGLPKRITPHSLRHAFASCLLDNGVDTRVIQVLLGHSRIDTTARYTAVSPARIAATASPLDQLLIHPRPKSGRPRKAKDKA
jgi:site-specific recombinase XerD